jgi:hypothetical protein
VIQHVTAAYVASGLRMPAWAVLAAATWWGYLWGDRTLVVRAGDAPGRADRQVAPLGGSQGGGVRSGEVSVTVCIRLSSGRG